MFMKSKYLISFSIFLDPIRFLARYIVRQLCERRQNISGDASGSEESDLPVLRTVYSKFEERKGNKKIFPKMTYLTDSKYLYGIV
jgi:hypothetical protein